MHLSVGLLLGPARAGDKEQLGVGPNRLLILLRRAQPGHSCAQRRQFDGDLLDLAPAPQRVRGKGRMRARIEQQEPRPRRRG